jgi:hypothetical protein
MLSGEIELITHFPFIKLYLIKVSNLLFLLHLMLLFFIKIFVKENISDIELFSKITPPLLLMMLLSNTFNYSLIKEDSR